MQSRVWNCSETVNRWLAVVFCIAILAIAATSHAQLAGNGSIQGSIADSTGAFIQGATVTATNTATQVKHTAVTQGNGLYSFPNLDIGTYTVEVTAQGFEHYSQTNIVLEVGSSIAVNVAMTVGRTDQKIEVIPEYTNAAYRAKIDAHIEQLRTLARAAGMDYKLLVTNQPLDQALREYLSLRQAEN